MIKKRYIFLILVLIVGVSYYFVNFKKGEQSMENKILEMYPNAKKTDSGMMYVVKQAGTGDTPVVGSVVTAHYTGRLVDGTKFDSSVDRDQPFIFKVGTGQVIKGWDEAFLAMKKGEKRTIILPHELAYGENGFPPVIPPRAWLIFDVELIDYKLN
jgi:FKBP-type peptidyl-prolyl cis-trans isomerase